MNNTHRETLGKVSSEERYDIFRIYEHLSGIEDLLKIVTPDSNPQLYKRLIDDKHETEISYKKWWSEMQNKYNWRKEHDARWEINFETCDIYLVKYL